MGELKEFKKSEIIMVEAHGKSYIGEAMVEDGAIMIDVLHNPCILSMQLIPQQTKLGGVTFATIVNMITLGVDTLNFESDESSNTIWGIVTNDVWIKQYWDTIKPEPVLKEATH